MILDTYTLLFVLVATCGLMAFMYLIAFWGARLPEAMLWTAMLFTEMLTWTLYGARGVWPDQGWIIVLGNTIMTLGWAFATQSLALFHRFDAPWILHYLPVPVSFLTTWWLVDNLPARLFVGSLIYVGQMLAGVAILVYRRESYPSNIRIYIAISIGFAGLAILARAGHGWLNPDVRALTPENSLMHTYVLLTAFVTLIAASCGFLLLLRDRTEQHIRHIASHDGLTGLWNRAAFIRMSEREIARCRRALRPVAMLMLDLDFFKRINDSHGHQVGDRVLVAAANALQAVLRPQDILGRYGGEEYCILLPEADLGASLGIAERLRKAVESLQIHAGEASIKPTISIGVAVPDGESSVDGMFSLADQALYRAKATGRNRVCGP